DIANNQLRYSFDNQIGSSLLELDHNGDIISQEEYYPFGGTAVFASRNTVEAKYKTVRYSGKERDATGLYYYGLRYYLPWLGRWLSSDPAGTIDGLNLYRMVRNNPVSLMDEDGLKPQSFIDSHEESSTSIENYRKSINELDFKSDYQQGISKLADIFVEYFNFIQKEKILQYVDKDSLIQQFSNESSLSLSEAKDYIEKTESFGFTASNLKGKPIFAFSDKNAGGEHYARHESIHLLSAPGGLTGLQTVNNNLNEAATEVTTRLIESHLGLNDSATMSAYNRAYPGLAEFVIKLIDVGGDRAKGGLLSSYLQNTGLTDMITPLAELWIERTDNNLIKQGFNKAPSNTDPLLRLEKATNLLGKDIIRLSGELGGQPNLKDITDFSIVSPIKKIGLKLGFSV
ncbi:RHS repeat domain-containing protein, partial [Yersinia intermedia]